MKIAILILLLVSASKALAPVIAAKCSAVQRQIRNWHGLENEISTILSAAERNNCEGKLLSVLLAIRKTENGPPGFEFGVKAVRGTDLETQARWAAATIVKNYQRWQKELWEGNGIVFINYLADRYCPPKDDPLGNINWKKNVCYWYQKFEQERNANN